MDGELREVAGEKQDRGLVIYRASRLEALLGPLRQLLAATQPANVLAPHTLIAAHPGMQQWLHGALARGHGGQGIAANLDILLPSAWIDRLAQQRLGLRAVSLPHYARQQLRWVVHAALGGDLAALGVTDPRIAVYLQVPGDAAATTPADEARRRFQLADRLAGLYSRYLVYRPDWLLAWERGQFRIASGRGDDAAMASTEQALLGPLWRYLRMRLGAHRGNVVGDLIAALRDQPGERVGEVLHVFGVSHLAPSELAVLRAYAQQQLVAMYVPDPCRHYWGGLGDKLAELRSARADELVRIDAAQGNDYWVEQSHPLLASWGRMGQHFIMALVDDAGDVLEDVRHWRDEQPAQTPLRLARLQQSIRELDPALLKVDLSNEAIVAAERKDASLRIHACHTRLRELEVLRDQLLDACGAGIRPGEMVVMAPAIQAYVPLIASVFGPPGDARERLLPYHLHDVAVSRSHSLFTAFRRLLDLPGTRIAAPEVMDLLAVPEVARQLDLDQAAVEEIGEWLKRSRVAWALDGAFRQRFGAPPIAEHTFGWALDRMLAGYLMATATEDDRQPGVTLADGSQIAPLTAIHGPAAEHLGALDQLLHQVQALCDLAEKTLPASAWAVQLESRFEALFRIDPDDREAREARLLLLRFIRGIASEPGAAGEDPPLHFAVVRDLLIERLAAAPERQRFLMGGVTFCGMIPQRAIPFKVVAVLGLNDGEFPRSTSDSGLDLMARHRRLGDRNVRDDDRYLFLETVMSARERLHLSYIGEGVRDGKARNPAAPLAELLAVLDDAAGPHAVDADTVRPWRIKHPLQPFDARYFNDCDPRLFSFNERFARMHGKGDEPAVAPFHDGAAPGHIELPQPIPLQELRDYYKDPAKQVLRNRMHVSLDALDDDRLPQDEPLEPRFEAIDKVTERLFFNDALPSGSLQDQSPAWLRLGGKLPPGLPGKAAWKMEHDKVDLLLERAKTLPGFQGTPPPAGNHEIDLRIGGHRLTGTVAHIFKTEFEGRIYWQLLRVSTSNKQELKLKQEKELNFKHRVPMFLDWALLRLQTAHDENLPAIRLQALTNPKDTPWQDGLNRWDEDFLVADAERRDEMRTDLEKRVAQLLDWWIVAQATPSWYFPKVAWESICETVYRKKDVADTTEKANAKVASAWNGSSDRTVGERDYAPGYSRLLAGDVDFEQGSPELPALHDFALELHACITMGEPIFGAGA